MKAHAAFDPLWRTLGMPRKQAYLYLQAITGLNATRAHIGKFDVEECRKVIDAIETDFKEVL